jgi:AmiR/NasT family two-component response regulator
VLVEQAKGVLAESAGLDLGAAFALLRGHARSHRRRLSDVITGNLDL